MGFLTYNEQTGLVVKTKAQIQEDLTNLLKQAYGQNLVISEGTELYAFVDVISAALTENGNAAKAVYDAFGFITASGTPLEVLCSTAGITRKTLPDGTLESDNALRARYYKFLYSSSVNTTQGLEARLLAYTYTLDVNGVSTVYYPVNEVTILNNDTSSIQTISGIQMVAHSIFVVVNIDPAFEEACGEQWGNSIKTTVFTDLDNIVLNYKSLGCAITVLSNPEPEPVVSYVYESVANQMFPSNQSLVLDVSSDIEGDNERKYAIINQVQSNLIDYINSLKMGEDILKSGVAACVYKAYTDLGYTDYAFSIKTFPSAFTSASITQTAIQKAFANKETITVTIPDTV
jgi:hypothetical protein